MAFPAILLAIAFMAARGPGVWNVILALSIVYMPRTALLIRSTVLSLRELDYVAGRARARPPRPRASRSATSCRTAWPRCSCRAPSSSPTRSSPRRSWASSAWACRPTCPSWGNVIASGKNVIREAFWVSLFPGIALTVAGLSLNLLGDGLRDTLDPRLRGSVGTGTGS